MRAVGPEIGGFGDYPVAYGEGERGGDIGAEGEDLEAAFVAGDGGGEGRTEEWGHGRARGVGALDLVYVGGVYGGGEGPEEEGGGGEGWGNGVRVEREDISWFSIFRVNKRFSLRVTKGTRFPPPRYQLGILWCKRM